MVNTFKCIPWSWLLIIIMFLTSCKGGKKDSTPPIPGGAASQVLTVQAKVVKPEKLASDVDVPGSILAYEETEIHPEVSGRIVTLHLPEGGQVNAGDLLAKLYDGDLQAQMRKLDVQLKIAEQTEQRQGELLKIQGISQQDYDLSLLEVQSLKADMDITKEAIRKTEIRAPFSGRLGLKNVSPGAYITPATVLTTISQISQLKIQFNVPERYSSQLKNGLEVHFSIEGNPNLFSANILATETSIEEETRSLTVRALIKNSKGTLRPGAFAKVRIVLGEDDKALMVPNTIIVPQGRKKQLFLYKGGKAMMSEVLTGVRDSTNIQILQGVNPGDTVITSAILFLRPGMNVTLGEVK